MGAIDLINVPAIILSQVGLLAQLSYCVQYCSFRDPTGVSPLCSRTGLGSVVNFSRPTTMGQNRCKGGFGQNSSPLVLRRLSRIRMRARVLWTDRRPGIGSSDCSSSSDDRSGRDLSNAARTRGLLCVCGALRWTVSLLTALHPMGSQQWQAHTGCWCPWLRQRGMAATVSVT